LNLSVNNRSRGS